MRNRNEYQRDDPNNQIDHQISPGPSLQSLVIVFNKSESSGLPILLDVTEECSQLGPYFFETGQGA